MGDQNLFIFPSMFNLGLQIQKPKGEICEYVAMNIVKRNMIMFLLKPTRNRIIDFFFGGRDVAVYYKVVQTKFKVF